MAPTDIFNALIERFGFQTALYVAPVMRPTACRDTHWITPDAADDFFYEKQSAMRQLFDAVFIDAGALPSDYSYAHIVNALMNLKDGGALVVAPVLPIAENETGFCWKAFVQVRPLAIAYQMESFTVDACGGVGVFKQGRFDAVKPKLFHDNRNLLTWENYQKRRTEWLNVVSLKRFDDWLSAYPTSDDHTH